MSYEIQLIGQLDIEDPHLPSIEITPGESLDSLVEKFGLIGQGLHIVASNPHIQGILEENDISSLTLSLNQSEDHDQRYDVGGLDALNDPEKGLVSELVGNQYIRGEHIFTAAKNAEFEELDAIAMGVAKGVALGMIPGAYFDSEDIQTVETDLVSRAGPGLIEASAISEEIEKLSKSEKRQSRFDKLLEKYSLGRGLKAVGIAIADFPQPVYLRNTTLYKEGPLELASGFIHEKMLNPMRSFGDQHGIRYVTAPVYHAGKFSFDLIVDAKNIIKRMPSGFAKSLNFGNWFDKYILQEKVSDDHTTNNQRWAEAQESAPFRGLMALGALNYVDPFIQPENFNSIIESFQQGDVAGITYGIAMGTAIGLAKFWINTGNNVQGINAVYQKYYSESDAPTKRGKQKEAWANLKDDAFQKAQMYICTGVLTGASLLEYTGLQAEKLLGNKGAGLQSAIQSGDTAYSALASKPLVRNNLIKPAEQSVTDENLLNMAQRYGSHTVIQRINSITAM